MPIEAKIKAQVKRLSGYQGYEDFKHELVRVLWIHADSDERAEKIVTRILDTRRPNDAGFIKCPSPAELIEYAEKENCGKALRPAQTDCPDCSGTGWSLIQDEGYSAAKSCKCRHR